MKFPDHIQELIDAHKKSRKRGFEVHGGFANLTPPLKAIFGWEDKNRENVIQKALDEHYKDLELAKELKEDWEFIPQIKAEENK